MLGSAVQKYTAIHAKKQVRGEGKIKNPILFGWGLVLCQM
jgi:hypothetical protein